MNRNKTKAGDLMQTCPICLSDIALSKILAHMKKHNRKGGENKYRAVTVECDGFIFRSELERDRYLQLKMLEGAGKIRDLELQPPFPCVVNKIKVTTYKADFRYFDVEKNEWVVEDTKGVRTEAFIVRKKLVEAIYGIRVIEVTREML